MEELQALMHGFAMIMEFKFFVYMFAGVTMGLVLGALPGLTGSMGIALLLPFTYNIPPLDSLVFLLAVYTGGLFGGGVTAVLINTPGAPSNIATTLDGYPMTLHGKPEEALGLSLFSSVAGGIIGCVFLVAVMEPLAALSLKFGPSEMFMVALFGLTVVGSLSNDVFKSLFSGLTGILLGTVGMSPNGVVRGTLDSVHLLDGIPVVPAFIGFLAIPELFMLIMAPVAGTADTIKLNPMRIVRTAWEVFSRPFQVLFCSIIGVVVGVMPAAGATVASLLSYNQVKQWSPKYDKFGTGLPEGVIASETANNASQGGSLATMLVLGIPGSAATAMLLGAVMIQGWIPGPRLFIEHKEIIYASISSLFIQQFVMLVIGLVLCVFAARIIRVPSQLLVPVILLFTILGAYSTRNTLFDAGLMLGFGVVGWFLRRNDFPIMPLVLGIILGPIADKELLRMVQIYGNNLWQIFERPITLGLFIVSCISVILPFMIQMVRDRKAKKSVAVSV